MTRFPPHEPRDEAGTSYEAAKSMRKTAPRQQERVVAFVASKGDHGATDEEIEGGLNLSHQSASARRRTAVLDGQLVDSGRKRKNATGRRAVVWVAADALPKPTFREVAEERNAEMRETLRELRGE